MRVFIGFDIRQRVAANVCRSSIERHASAPVDIQLLNIRHLPVQRVGLTEFTFSRYLVPLLCNYEGIAVFLDADMILRADIHELSGYVDGKHSVYVVKAPLRFEWPSMMVFDNERCKRLTPEVVASGKPQTFDWADGVGELPQTWNFCVGYDDPKDVSPKLVHYTQGIPCWPETKGCDFAQMWHDEHRQMNGTVSWRDLMGNSIHAEPVLKRLQAQ
jgi:lipopolysaccharide biosynthesis glycosyltransferase